MDYLLKISCEDRYNIERKKATFTANSDLEALQYALAVLMYGKKPSKELVREIVSEYEEDIKERDPSTTEEQWWKDMIDISQEDCFLDLLLNQTTNKILFENTEDEEELE